MTFRLLLSCMILIACDASIKVEQFRSDEPLEGPESSDLAEETSPPLEESLPEDRSSDRETPPDESEADGPKPIPQQSEEAPSEAQKALPPEPMNQQDDQEDHPPAEDPPQDDPGDEITEPPPNKRMTDAPNTFEEPFTMPIPITGARADGFDNLSYKHKVTFSNGGPVVYGFHGYLKLTSKSQGEKTEYFLSDPQAFQALAQAIRLAPRFANYGLDAACPNQEPIIPGPYSAKVFFQSDTESLHYQGAICRTSGPWKPAFTNAGLERIYKLFEDHHKGELTKAPEHINLEAKPPLFGHSSIGEGRPIFSAKIHPIKHPSHSWMDFLWAKYATDRFITFKASDQGVYTLQHQVDSKGEKVESPDVHASLVKEPVRLSVVGKIDEQDGEDIVILTNERAIRLLSPINDSYTTLDIPKGSFPMTLYHMQALDIDEDGFDNLILYGYKGRKNGKKRFYIMVSKKWEGGALTFSPPVFLGHIKTTKSPEKAFLIQFTDKSRVNLYIPFPELMAIKELSINKVLESSEEFQASNFKTFTDQQPHGLAWGDLNGDQFNDLGIISKPPGRPGTIVSFFPGGPAGISAQPTTQVPMKGSTDGISFLDTNNDGYQDIVVEYAHSYGILHGGRLGQPLNFYMMIFSGSIGYGSKGMADINQDGKMDFFGHGMDGLILQIQGTKAANLKPDEPVILPIAR